MPYINIHDGTTHRLISGDLKSLGTLLYSHPLSESQCVKLLLQRLIPAWSDIAIEASEAMSTPRIGLALSGGGFRATLFHLGVVRLLYEAGLISNVRRITSVSGGSILAAHLALNWGHYTGTPEDFERAAAQVTQFTRADIRGRIVRRWAFAWITVLPRLFKHRRWQLTALLKHSYDDLFARARLSSLPAHPSLSILSTSMTTGALFSFDRDGVSFDDSSGPSRITTNTLEVAYAVAASSAFLHCLHRF